MKPTTRNKPETLRLVIDYKDGGEYCNADCTAILPSGMGIADMVGMLCTEFEALGRKLLCVRVM